MCYLYIKLCLGYTSLIQLTLSTYLGILGSYPRLFFYASVTVPLNLDRISALILGIFFLRWGGEDHAALDQIDEWLAEQIFF